MDYNADTVYKIYGFDDQFPISWTDATVDEKELSFVLGDDTSKPDKKAGKKDDDRVLQRNFDVFVKMKSTVDTAYLEMKRDFLQERKNWGVASISNSIEDANERAVWIMKPIVDSKVASDRLKATLSLIDRHRYLFDLPASLQNSISTGDSDLVVRDYRRGRALTEEIRTLPHSSELTDYYVQQRRVIERIWGEVEIVIEDYKSDVWQKLIGATADDSSYLSYITILLEIGVEDNPILVWLGEQIKNLKKRMKDTFHELNKFLYALQQDLEKAEKPSQNSTIYYFLNAIKLSIDSAEIMRDSPEIVMTWSRMSQVIDEVVKYFGKQIKNFWLCASGFLDGQTQKNLPTGINGESKVHLSFSKEQENQLRTESKEIVELFSSSITEFFLNTVSECEEKAKRKLMQTAETEDFDLSERKENQPTISESSGNSVMNLKNPSVASLSASAMLASSLKNDRIADAQKYMTSDRRPRTPPLPVQQQEQQPPPSPGSLKNFELYAFLPTSSNAISATYFLAQIVGSVGTVASDLSNLAISSKHVETLRNLVSTVRERCTSACCLAWQQDAKRLNILEDWRVAPSRRGTRLPTLFLAYQTAVWQGLHRVMYVENAEKKADVHVVMPPSSKIVSNIKTQFVNSIFLVLDGLMHDAVASDKKRANDGPAAKFAVPSESRILLTICNITELKDNIVPRMFERFSKFFGITLTDNSNIMGDSLKQADEQLFNAYTKKKRAHLSSIIRGGILKSGIRWGELEKPTDVDVYIYEALLALVHVHAQVFTVAPSLIERVISELLKHIISTIVECFRQVDKFSFGGLLQGTIDVQLIDQEMSNYITPEIEELCKTAYTALQDATDRSQMDVNVMTSQLEEMKKLLGRCHKNSRVEFLCFKEKRSKPSESAQQYQPQSQAQQKQYRDQNIL
ncbi:exocyst complex component Sec5-domain-containing protein [Myxozyma melibiosi]|uniref:Exocyst complex component SEC5 n=1 Tax=Myxozyma melibiosi TaxID=54550 RepID=A0ABR1F0P6_9ASCO